MKNKLLILKQKFQKLDKTSFQATLMAIVIGLLIGLIIMLISKPAEAFPGFIWLSIGGFSNFANVLYFATPILMTGLSVGLAFKSGLFNIGAAGQYTMGMFFAILVGFFVPLPGSIHWIVAILAGFVGGFLWGIIPGILKAFFNVNEVIASIMLNYIGMYIVDMLIVGSRKMFVFDTTRTAYLPSTVKIPSLGITGSNLNIGFLFAILIAIVIYIILKKTIFGYEVIATGLSKSASHYAGINYKKNTILVMAIAGGLAGLGGAFMILAPTAIAGSSVTYEPINILAANGFTGMAVALLGSSNPIGIIFSAIFVSHIQRGGSLVTGMYSFKPEIADIIIALIIYISAFSVIVNQFIIKKIKHLKEKKISKVIVESEREK